MLRKRYYIVFIARDEDGHLRRVPLPLKYAYGFVLAAIVGAFTIVGLAGSYTRMLLKTESYNQVRAERETLRQNYQRMEQIAHNRSVQVRRWGRWPTRSPRSTDCARTASRTGLTRPRPPLRPAPKLRLRRSPALRSLTK